MLCSRCLIFKSFLKNRLVCVYDVSNRKTAKEKQFFVLCVVDLARKWHVLSFIFECDKHQPHHD